MQKSSNNFGIKLAHYDASALNVILNGGKPN